MKVNLKSVWLFFVCLFWFVSTAVSEVNSDKAESTGKINFKVFGSDSHKTDCTKYRRMIIGPWLNQPEQYEGYNGFVGWAGVTRLRSGRWLLTFTSGYWHVSWPWTEEIAKNKELRKEYDLWQEKFHFTKVIAPRGGRMHIMYSDDKGETWSKPQTLIDTEKDDRHPTILELDDGTLLCTFFDYALAPLSRVVGAKYMYSTDGGATWSDVMKPPGEVGGFSNGPAIQLTDGTVVWVSDGKFGLNIQTTAIGVYRSSDRGRTFKLASVVTSDHELCEPTVAQLPSGQLVMITRPESDICFSDDGGRSWTKPVSIGVKLFDPHLLMLPNGVLACFHGSYAKGGLRVIISPDGGQTWHGPGENFGYCVDPTVYGYSHPMLLEDGTVYLVYQHSGGHFAADARTQALWALRVRINDAADGIEILPPVVSHSNIKVNISSRGSTKMLSEEAAGKLKRFHMRSSMAQGGCLLRYDDHGLRGDIPAIIPYADMVRSRIYTGARKNGSYNHHPQLNKFKGKYYCAWSNGIVNEETAGQRVLISCSQDCRRWSEVICVAGDKADPVAAYNCIALHATKDKLYIVTMKENCTKDANLPGMRRIDPESQYVYIYASSDGSRWERVFQFDKNLKWIFEAPRVTADGFLMCVAAMKDGPAILRWPSTEICEHPEVITVPPPHGARFPYGEGSWYQTDDGTIIVYWRDEGLSCRLWMNYSTDGGKTFSEPVISDIPDSMSRVYVGRVADGRYFICNNAYPVLLNRMHLMLMLSDDGYTFDKVYILADEPTAQRYPDLLKVDGYQYPCCLPDGDKLRVAYSVNKEDIECGTVDLSKLK